ncbi:unnamed protein product [Dovyalis caffra]|uniref:Uncharacterized protein n=1 Tax=Dovyalis caffra TaxID=77055 RepID=A0AAV1QV41_9ROSI|nr:unnamed protein product [Dovyalis caffra]
MSRTRVDDDMGDEDDDMGDDGDEDEDDDEDIAKDGAGMMSLVDTDMEDHDDTGLGDDYNDEMIDEEDDDFHENRVIEVRWREALDGLDNLRVSGRLNSGVQENQPSDDPLSNDGQLVVDGDNTDESTSRLQQENGNEVTHYRPNPIVDPRSSFNGASEGLQVDEPMLVQPISPNKYPKWS